MSSKIRGIVTAGKSCGTIGTLILLGGCRLYILLSNSSAVTVKVIHIFIIWSSTKLPVIWQVIWKPMFAQTCSWMCIEALFTDTTTWNQPCVPQLWNKQTMIHPNYNNSVSGEWGHSWCGV